MHRETKLLHYGRPSLPGPANPPVVRASTVLHDTLNSYEDTLRRRESEDDVLSYGRRGTTTAHALMKAIADIEGGDAAWLYPTGVAAIATALQALVHNGDHLLVVDTVFPATRSVIERYLRPNGVSVDYFPWDATDLSPWLRPETRLVFVESPGSFTLEVMDLPALCKSAHKHGALVITDNTYASGWLCRPLALGCDVSIIAGTKYLSGHADTMMGAATARGSVIKILREATVVAGQTLGPDEAYATLRGMRTLSLRLERHEASALTVAEWLSGHDGIERVLHPGLPDHPGYEVWQRDGTGTNGLLSVAFSARFDARAFADALRLFAIGSSWGGFESLVKPFAPPPAGSAFSSEKDWNFVRLHVGLEHVDDLLEDLDRALAAARR